MRPRRRPALAIVALAIVALAIVAYASVPAEAPARASSAAGEQAAGWTLAWSDEFDGPAGSAVDGSKWVADTGGQGGGNHEREYYTPGVENAALDGAGHLVITARVGSPDSRRRCWYGPCRYTSARLQTRGRLETTYGRFEARIRIPRGQGLWPAFWMLGADIGSVGWPASGEIDVMENIGREPATVHGTMHGPGYSGERGITGKYALSGAALADDFHRFAVEWTPKTVRWLIDDREYHRATPGNLPSGARWVFDRPFFLLLNVAVGGSWPGDPDPSTTFPQQMLVDYVRVYRQH